MKITRTCCQGCGADLRIDESIRFATCNYCGANLEIIHDETTTHSKLLEEIGRKTDKISRKVEILELESDIDQIDRAWEQYREKVSTRDEQGRLIDPENGSIIAGCLLGFFFGVVFVVWSFAESNPLIALPGLFAFVASTFLMKRARGQAEAYRIQRFKYQTAKKSLLQKLEQARQL